MQKKLYLLFLPVVLLVADCQSLEDTYSKYAGDGMIRYVGKCYNLKVTSGWKRLILTWENSLDPTIDKIVVTWKAGETLREKELDKNATSYEITDVGNENYEITVFAMDKEGNRSLKVPEYARPFSEDHESVRSFTRGIIKHYPVKDNLVLFFDQWSANIEKFTMNYYDTGGERKAMELTEGLFAGEYYVLEDVDTDRPVAIDREGRIPGCPDLIVFAPYELDNERSFSSDFNLLLRTRYGQENPDDTFVQNVRELEIDYTINSFEDILYFPNLEKLVLGKNRYLYPAYLATSQSNSIVYEKARSLFVLNAANRLSGVTVERYNKHYLPDETLAYMEDKGNPSPPALSYLNTAGWVITNSVPDAEQIGGDLKNLLDNDPETYWQTEMSQTSSRIYQLEIDMQAETTLNGFKVSQKRFEPSSDRISAAWMPGMIRVQASNDRLIWRNVMNVEDIIIGNTSGEVTIQRMPEPPRVRYVRITITDGVYGQNFAAALGDFMLF